MKRAIWRGLLLGLRDLGGANTYGGIGCAYPVANAAVAPTRKLVVAALSAAVCA